MVYIDEVIILNFIIDYLLLLFTSYVLKLNTLKYKLFLSSLFGEISILYLFFDMNNLFLILFKLSICSVMIFISFGKCNFKEFIKRCIYFYILSFFLGGVLYYFKIENLVKYEIYFLFIPVILNIYKYFAYHLTTIINTHRKVTIYLNNGKILFLNGFIDTGNSLIDPYSKKKVIIINRYVYDNYYLIPYKTVDSECLLKCFKPNKVYIEGIGERNDVVVGVVHKKFNGYDCLINYRLMEE